MHLNLEMISNKDRFKSQYNLKPGSIMGNTEKFLSLSTRLLLVILEIFFQVCIRKTTKQTYVSPQLKNLTYNFLNNYSPRKELCPKRLRVKYTNEKPT